MFGSRESLAGRLNKPRPGQVRLSLGSASPGQVLVRSQSRDSKQIDHHKSFSDLNKGLDSIFHAKSRPPSRISNFGDALKEKEEKRKESCPEKGSPSTPLMKSLSRSYIYDAETGGETGVQDDDLDVYHTITGGKLRSITATRSTDPYSKITRRPLHKLLSGQRGLRGKTESLASLADLETDSVLSWGRVRRVSSDYCGLLTTNIPSSS